MSHGSSPSREGLESFRQALRELGRVDGQNITIEYRSTGGKGERAPELLAELIQLKVDLIYTPGSIAAAQAAQRATTTISIVFYTPADPVRAGLVANLSRPGGNITGLTGGGIESSKRGKAGALYVMADAMCFEERKRIVALSAQGAGPLADDLLLARGR